MTQEKYDQLITLCSRYGENQSQVISRAIQMLHLSLRLTDISYREETNKNV